MSGDVLDALSEARRSGRTVVLSTTVRVDGDPPSRPGNRALFAEDGTLLAGTIGCNGLDRSAGRDASALIAGGRASGFERYTSFEGEPGEGAVEVFLEAFSSGPRLLVWSEGPVAEALERLGAVIGLAVERMRGPLGAEARSQLAGMGRADAAVFVDHDDPDLLDALRAVLGSAAGYVGVMGSRRHTPGFAARMRDEGFDLARLRSPTGLDLGARTPPEIALSILAEVLAAGRGRSGGRLDIVNAGHGADGREVTGDGAAPAGTSAAGA